MRIVCRQNLTLSIAANSRWHFIGYFSYSYMELSFGAFSWCPRGALLEIIFDNIDIITHKVTSRICRKQHLPISYNRWHDYRILTLWVSHLRRQCDIFKLCCFYPFTDKIWELLAKISLEWPSECCPYILSSVKKLLHFLSPCFLKKAMGILRSPASVCPSVKLSPPKPYRWNDAKIKTNFRNINTSYFRVTKWTNCNNINQNERGLKWGKNSKWLSLQLYTQNQN